MDHVCKKSPESSDGALEVATGETSEESTTLQNALKPLPDTQPDSQDYQRISSGNHVNSAAAFISRPIQPDVDDLSIGFTFHKPAAIVPGQFSGRKQSKSLNPIVEKSMVQIGIGPSKESILEEEKTATRGSAGARTNPPVPARRLSPQGTGIVPKAQADQNVHSPVDIRMESHSIQSCQVPRTVQGMPFTVSRARKKATFEDYQPACRASNVQTQTQTPVTYCEAPIPAQIPGPLAEQNMASNNDAKIQQTPLRQAVNQSTVDSSLPKQRTSFQNDVSVSSAHPPRKMPGSSPRAAMVNRPVRDSHSQKSSLNTPATRPRSGHSIARSNSKAKRKTHPAQVSSSSRPSSRHTNHDEETPSMQRRSKWTPAELLQERFHQKLATTATDLAGCFNDKFADIQAEVDQHLQTIADLKIGMSKQRNDVSRCKERMLGKDDKIQQLEEDRRQLVAKVNTTNQELDARSTKISKLEEKCRSYKDFLNSAIGEQQELYKATKAKCDMTITQMRAEESRRNALQERERKHAEVTRENLKQLVQSTVTEYKQKEREFDDQLKLLSQRVQEREADVMRERETTQKLLQQNGSFTNIKDALKAFEAQMGEMAGKVHQVMGRQCQQDDLSVKDVSDKLENIMQYLQVLDERTLPTADLYKKIHELNEKTVVQISEKLDPVLAAQLQTKTSLDSLCSGVEACMEDIWEELSERQDTLEEYWVKQNAERKQSVSLLNQEIEHVRKELAQQNQLFLQSEKAVREREATIDTMELEITRLEQAQEQHAAESERLDRLREENARLKDDTAAKASLVSKLRSKLQESTEKLAAEEGKHQEHTAELHSLMEQRMAEAMAAQVLAVEDAQHDAMLKMDEIKADIDARLTQAVAQRAALQKELDEARQNLATIEAESSSISEKAAHLEEEMQSARARAAEEREQASLRDAEQQTASEQQRKLVQNLQAQLAAAQERFDTLSGNVMSYDAAARTVLLSLREWTKNYAAIQSMAHELRKDGDKNGIHNQVNPRFKLLFELQLLQTAVSQYCQTQKEAVQMLSGDTTAIKTASQMLPTMHMAAGSILDRIRRVTVMSPASNASSPQPPSVQIEQERRRIGEQPKSILKLILPQASQSSEDDSRRELLSNTSLNRGPYNRLVAGQGRRTGQSTGSFIQRGGPGGDRVSELKAGTAPVAGETKKRKQNVEPELDVKQGKYRKGDKSTYFTPGSSSPGPDFDSVTRSSRNAGWIGTVNHEQPNSLAASQSSQEQSQSQAIAAGSRISLDNLFNTHPRSSQSNSHDPLTLFMQRRHLSRANEDSQELLTHSQDVGDNEDREFPISRRYTSGP